MGRGFVRGLRGTERVVSRGGCCGKYDTVLAVSIPMAYKRQSRKDGFAEYKKQTRMLLPIKKIISYIRKRYDYALDYCRYTFRCVCRGDLNSCQMRYQKIWRIDMINDYESEARARWGNTDAYQSNRKKRLELFTVL